MSLAYSVNPVTSLFCNFTANKKDRPYKRMDSGA